MNLCSPGWSQIFKLKDVRAICLVHAPTKPERLVEVCRLGILSPQPQPVEFAPRCLDDLRHQLPTDSFASMSRQDIDMTHSTHARLGPVRIYVQPAHADDPAVPISRE